MFKSFKSNQFFPTKFIKHQIYIQLKECYPLKSTHINCFGVRLLANVQKDWVYNLGNILKKYLQTSVRKWHKIERKKSKMSKFFVDFRHFQ